MSHGERAEALAHGIIGPVIVGGPIRLQRPFGPKMAFEMSFLVGAQREIVDNDLRARVDTARLRTARTLVAVDALRPLGAAEWALAAGFNDLLQVTNHELSSFATRSRHTALLDAVHALASRVPVCRQLEEAVARHATFSRVLEVARTDTDVTWWTGSSSFRGQKPPQRLMAWPGLRNVRISKQSVRLANMAAGVNVVEDGFHDALGAWLSCSPITDLATAFRTAPRFAWSRHSVALVATVGGSNLALRAISWATNDRPEAAEAAVTALRDSAAKLPEGAPRQIAAQFAKWLEDAKAHWVD
jgi:hypothetical protein